MYGGAAGGGKSDALLMAALRYVDVPHYAAIIFRRSFADLSLPGAIMDRARDWLAGSDARWNDNTKTFTFPSGATLTFAYLATENDKYRYQGAEFQFIGFDELTQFVESQYRYLFSRLRRVSGSDVPLRMRAASNPGGIGHEWVKARFIDRETAAGEFVPATRRDNPHLDNASYDASLDLLDPTTKQQLDSGDWDALPAGEMFDRSWVDVVDAAPPCPQSARYWDFAATEPSDANKDPDWTVGLLLGRAAPSAAGRDDGCLYVLDVARFRKGPAGVESEFRAVSAQDGRAVPVGMEQEGGASGKAFADSLIRQLPGFDVRAVRATGEKAVRARPAAAQARIGNLKIVRGAWNRAFVDELHSFPGGAHDDQVDALSGALELLAVCRYSGGVIFPYDL